MSVTTQDAAALVLEAIAREDLRQDLAVLIQGGGVDALRRGIQLGLVVMDGKQSASAVDDFLLRRNEPVTRILTIVKFYDNTIEVGVRSDDPERRPRQRQA